MAAQVSRQIKSDANSGLITRDFLGGGVGIDSKELDLDLHVPNGWEKRLDLKSGKVYIERSNTANSASEEKNDSEGISQKPNVNNSNSNNNNNNNAESSSLTGLLEQASLDLKLVPNYINNASSSSSVYTSVCTLDKVKSALDRAERASPASSSSSSSKRLRMMNGVGRSQSPSNSSSLSDERESSRLSIAGVSSSTHLHQVEGLLVAAACPTCLLYVLISKNDPKCPKCFSALNLPLMSNNPKIDLNL